MLSKINMVTARICSKLKTSRVGKNSRYFVGIFNETIIGTNSQYFVGIFNKTTIPLALVGYEMIIANSVLCTSAIYHHISNAHSWSNC